MCVQVGVLCARVWMTLETRATGRHGAGGFELPERVSLKEQYVPLTSELSLAQVPYSV